MSMNETTLADGTILRKLPREPRAIEFYCNACKKEKKSKNIFERIRGNTTETICNGCNGELLKDGGRA